MIRLWEWGTVDQRHYVPVRSGKLGKWTNRVGVMDHRLGATLPAVRNDEVLEKEKRICNFVSEVGSP